MQKSMQRHLIPLTYAGRKTQNQRSETSLSKYIPTTHGIKKKYGG